VEGKDTGGLTASEYARSINLLSSLPKPALPRVSLLAKSAGHDAH